MKVLIRIFLVILLLVAALYFIFKGQVDDRLDQYGFKDYVKHRVKNTFKGASLDQSPALSGVTEDKAVVMAKVARENTDWVLNKLPEYERSPSSPLDATAR